MNVTIDDLVSARIWAEENCGDDAPLDVYQHKLFEIAAKSHGSSAGYHERSQSKCEALMSAIEARFKIEPEF